MRTAFVIALLGLFMSAGGASDSAFTYKDHIKKNFEDTFHKKCDKYEFVRKWVNKLEYTDDNFITFVYQESRFRNGGLGDRFGGIVSAVAIATMYNRTLLLRAEGDYVSKVFRPYHPTDIHNPVPKYDYHRDKWETWSHYSAKYALNDDTEYDVYDCINNGGSKNRHCSIADGNPHQPHILYRSNRAYLCHYDNNPQNVGGECMNRMGINKTTDLFEVAGCMMRLALWPTDYLWEEVDKIYRNFEGTLHFDDPKLMRRALRGIASAEMKKAKSDSRMVTNTTALHSASATAQKPVATKEERLLRAVPPTAGESRVLDEPIPTPTSEQMSAVPFYQVGMHFRCGDKAFMGRAGDQCVYDPVARPYEPGLLPGNPVGIAQCAKDTMTNYTASLFKHHISVDGDGAIVPETGKYKERPPQRPAAPHVRQLSAVGNVTRKFEMMYITSDSLASADQMLKTAGHPYTLISPQGCHIEMDGSVGCHVFTVSYWFVLAMSDILVTQTLGDQHTGGPTSSFSRYAGIYGLKDSPFRDGRHCEEFTSNFQLSRIQQSNWFC